MIHFFNPGHETAVLNGSSFYTNPSNVDKMAHDLAFLPAWYACNAADRVIVRDCFDDYFYTDIKAKYPGIASYVTEGDVKNVGCDEFSFWGISPKAIHGLGLLLDGSVPDNRIPNWDERFVYWNSRLFSKDILGKILGKNLYKSSVYEPVIICSLDELETYIALNRNNTWLLKAPYSSSGRGLLWLRKEGIGRSERQIICGILKKQGYVCLERVLKKKLDFAMEFFSYGNGHFDFKGYSLFETNSKGAYLGNKLMSQSQIKNLLFGYVDKTIFLSIQHVLTELLAKECSHVYSGCLGVDMMLFEENDRFFLHPCLEVNMRYNMGYLAMCLYRDYIGSATQGYFHVDFFKGEGQALVHHCQMQEQYPSLIQGGRLLGGYQNLCPVDMYTCYNAYVVVE